MANGQRKPDDAEITVIFDGGFVDASHVIGASIDAEKSEGVEIFVLKIYLDTRQVQKIPIGVDPNAVKDALKRLQDAKARCSAVMATGIKELEKARRDAGN